MREYHSLLSELYQSLAKNYPFRSLGTSIIADKLKNKEIAFRHESRQGDFATVVSRPQYVCWAEDLSGDPQEHVAELVAIGDYCHSWRSFIIHFVQTFIWP